MAQWQRVYPRFWPDMRGAKESTKLTGLYLLTGQHRTTEGYYHLPIGYATEDTELPARKVQGALDDLQERRFISYDPQSKIIFIRKALSIPGQAPVSPKQITGALRAMAHLTPSPLWEEFKAAAREHAPKLAAEIDRIENTSGTPSEPLPQTHSGRGQE